MIDFDKKICSNLSLARQREWLETNGLGGFAASTLSGMNTRRYHGLLVAALDPPVKRYVLLSKLEESLVLDGAHIDLSSNQYPGAVHPQGYQFLSRFEKHFFPVATFQIGEWKVRKTVFMLHGKNASGIEYAFDGPAETMAGFEVRPLLAYRDYHSLTHENSAVNRDVVQEQGRVIFHPYFGLPPLSLFHTAGTFCRDGYWYKSCEYSWEQERGLDFSEDLFSPGYFSAEVVNGSHLWFLASVDETLNERTESPPSRMEQFRATEQARRRVLVTDIPSQQEALFHLRLAADQFLVRRGEKGCSVIAGYPWFTDWGRDTLISLPGLFFVDGNFRAAREILKTLAQSMSNGIVPNRFREQRSSVDTAEYNTADATLWLFNQVYEYAARSGEMESIKKDFYELLIESFEWHRRGTHFSIRMTDDGLLEAGGPDVQLTWMDAKIGDWVVTPRHGKAVEICALWYNALRILEFFSRKFGDKQRAKEFKLLSAQAKESFNQVFWNPEVECLNDVVNEQGADPSVRPNQLFAISLPFSPLSKERQKQIVSVVGEELLTPYGLRTLAQRDPHYRGLYGGNLYERDSAYHQGTVWPWLLGPFATAYLKAFSRTTKNKRRVRSLLEPVLDYLLHEGVGQLPEVFDGDVSLETGESARPRGKGCYAQAWSVAEIRRVLLEEV